MAKSFFREKTLPPDAAMLADVLQPATPLWDELIEKISSVYPAFAAEWKYYGAGWGWSFVIKTKSKTLCYLTPAEGAFFVSVIFNEKGRQLALAEDLPQEVARGVKESQNNAKNIPYDFSLATQTDIPTALKLIELRART